MAWSIRWAARRGALVGHLAMFEIGSAIPSRRYGNAIRRLGLATPAAVDFFDEHVEADAVHEQIASVDMCGAFVAENPELAADVLFGARCSLAMDGLAAEHLLGAWEAGGTALRRIPQHIVDDAPRQVATVTRGAGGNLAWPALLRKLDRTEPDYKR